MHTHIHREGRESGKEGRKEEGERWTDKLMDREIYEGRKENT